MPRAIQLTETEKRSILDLYKENKSHREIARKINRSKTALTKIHFDMAQENELAAEKRSMIVQNGLF